jgi:Flp pilus assembly protein TadG
MSGLRTFFRDRTGAAAAEMALMLPLLVTLLFVTFEGGYFLWSEHKVVKGVRDGARYAGRLPFSYYANCPAAPASPAAVEDPALPDIQEITRTGKLSGGTPMVAGWENSHVTVTCDHVSGSDGLYETNAGVAPRVTVSAAVPYAPSPITDVAKVFGFDAGSITLRASAQAAVMGL